MTTNTVPDDLRRFILTSIASVPHLEALLLLRTSAYMEWDSETVARRLYIGDRLARKLLDELCEMGMLVGGTTEQKTWFRYGPGPGELVELVDRLAAAYATNLVGITELIHSKTDRQAQQLSDAFTWKKGN